MWQECARKLSKLTPSGPQLGPKVDQIWSKLAPQQRLVHSTSGNQHKTAATQRDAAALGPPGGLLGALGGPRMVPLGVIFCSQSGIQGATSIGGRFWSIFGFISTRKKQPESHGKRCVSDPLSRPVSGPWQVPPTAPAAGETGFGLLHLRPVFVAFCLRLAPFPGCFAEELTVTQKWAQQGSKMSPSWAQVGLFSAQVGCKLAVRQSGGKSVGRQCV